MDRNDSEENRQALGDDVDNKIRALETELASVSSKEDRKIFWGVIGLIIFVILYKMFQFNPVVFIVVIPIVVFGGILLVIYENVRKKKNILIKRGLKCSNCGHLPKPFNASGLYYSQLCPKCRARLNI